LDSSFQRGHFTYVWHSTLKREILALSQELMCKTELEILKIVTCVALYKVIQANVSLKPKGNEGPFSR